MRQIKIRRAREVSFSMTHQAIENADGKVIGYKKVKGPKKTKPCHGKVHRIPYDARIRAERFGLLSPKGLRPEQPGVIEKAAALKVKIIRASMHKKRIQARVSGS